MHIYAYLCSLCPTFCTKSTKMTQGSIKAYPCFKLSIYAQNVGHNLHNMGLNEIFRTYLCRLCPTFYDNMS